MQAEIAARAEHRRQRREPREGVYKGFISAASALVDHLYPVAMFDMSPHDDFSPAFAERATELAAEVRKKWLEVVLAGPKSLAEVATKVDGASQSAAKASDWLARYRADSDDTRRGFGISAGIVRDGLKEFIAGAQAALDDDGTNR
ncbi:hypothetical protein ACFV29_12930 [Streptomyces sp. NPDC059690]|uniref:hypothetical protein n=1 Tax=Streptomyces sp. NPDC059690 TaxID=3346907 RepID=UPI0036C6C5C1